MSTRRSIKRPGARQERFASAAVLGKPILGNLVARRCETVASAEDRELIWWLQELSLRDRAGAHFACTSFPAWQEMPGDRIDLLPFERLAMELCQRFASEISGDIHRVRRAMTKAFRLLCLDPACDFATFRLPGFPGFIAALRHYQRDSQAWPAGRVAATSVTRQVWEGLDFCHAQRGIVLLEGAYRSGKSYSAQAWCLARPGRARYVQLGAYTDATSFFRIIARSFGTASTAQRKAIEIRQRVEDALRSRDLMLVIDEAEHLLGSSARPMCAPDRLNYLIKDLDNRGIAVALLTGLNFARSLENLERKLPNWGAEQFYGRLGLRVRLPDALEQTDLFAIAGKLLPEADEPTRMLLVGHTLESKGRLGALEHAAKRALYFANSAGRSVAFDDMERTIEEVQSTKLPFRGRRANTPQRARDAIAPPPVADLPAGRSSASLTPLRTYPAMFTGARTPAET